MKNETTKQDVRLALKGTGVMLGDGCLELVEADGTIKRFEYRELPTGTEREILESISHHALALSEEFEVALRIYGRVAEKIKKIWDRKLAPKKTYKMRSPSPVAAQSRDEYIRRPCAVNKRRKKRYSPNGLKVENTVRPVRYLGGIYLPVEKVRDTAC